ncbi:hypothetical protein [Rubrivivax gelatinosus]|uniref:hypothetical protein n=1 Tax=Rubrivivax gelatinosus TaxID=28068 RepID=UPI001A2C9598|nr:hypothetical protein [Rubrivivax gelatinosus]MBG6083091.1 hypothetical protein [Rubrivivax gelatinosus]
MFDSRGHQHSVAFWSQAQLLTSSRGRLFLWDAQEGRCLLQGMEGLMLSNARPSESASHPISPVSEQLRQNWKESTLLLDRVRTAARQAARASGARGPGEPSAP